MPFGNAVGEGFVNPGIVVANKVIIFGSAEGLFMYNGTPALGNPPLLWITPQSTDPFGNAVAPNGVGVYNNDSGDPLWALLSEGAAQFATSLAALTGNFAGEITTAAAGQLILTSGGTSGLDSEGSVVIGSKASSGGSTRTSIQTDKTVLNNSGGPTPVAGVSGSILTLPPDANSGTTWVSGERAFMNNNWVANINSNFQTIITALQTAGIIT